MRYFFLIYVVGLLALLVAAGTRGHSFKKPPFELFPDMDHQARINYQSESDFFADGVGSRVPVAGTVPMGYGIPEAPASDATPEERAAAVYYQSGRFGDYWGHGMPDQVAVDQAFLAEGHLQYEIYCTVCHGETGNGKGPTSQFGILNAANFHAPDFVDAGSPAYRPDGSIFDTITNGKGLMGSYGANIPVEKRWAIVAYLRALQVAGKQ